MAQIGPDGKKSKVYAAWVNMRQRCHNTKRKDFQNYGGRRMRPITFAQRWDIFENFLADMGEPLPGMTLERIDNMGDYTPENCRWATRHEQGQNKRNNVRYDWQGQSLTLPEWSRQTGIPRLTLYKRLQAGWSVDRAFTEQPPPDIRRPKGTALYEWNGTSHTLSDWSKHLGIPRLALYKRLQRGWPMDRVFTA